MASVAVIGPGSIGATMAAALHQQGHSVALIGRQVVGQVTVHIAHDYTPSTLVVPGVPVAGPQALTQFDAAVLATKATHVAAAAPWIRAAHTASLPVFIAQNGIDQRERIEAVVGSDPTGLLVPVVVYLGAHRDPEGAVHLVAPGHVVVPEGPHAQRLAAWLDPHLVEVRSTPDFVTHAWRKLLVNSSTGVFAVLAGRGGRVVDDLEARELLVGLINEAAEVGRAEGAELGSDIGEEIADLIASSPGDFLPSIGQDRRNGLPSEWRERNEVIVRLAARHGIDVPLNRLSTVLMRLGEPPG